MKAWDVRFNLRLVRCELRASGFRIFRLEARGLGDVLECPSEYELAVLVGCTQTQTRGQPAPRATALVGLGCGLGCTLHASTLDNVEA